MLPVSSAFIEEINKIAADSVTTFLLEVQLPSNTLRFVANNESVTWNSQTWLHFPFKIESLNDSGKGEIPSVTVTVEDATGQIQRAVEAVDGGNNSPVILRIVNLSVTSDTEPELELSFVIKKSTWSNSNIVFILTGANCLTRRVPPDRYLKDFCRFASNYGGIRCGVSTATKTTYPTCNGTRANCIERGNLARFGGFPGMENL